MTFHIEGSIAPARLPSRLDIESEFMMLYALRERTTARLNDLEGALRTQLGLPMSPAQRMRADEAAKPVSLPIVRLPASGLAQAAPGVLLFKRGRDA